MSITRFRQYVGSIDAHMQTYTHTHTQAVHRFSCHGVCRLFCMFPLHPWRVMSWRARWPDQTAVFPPGGRNVHYVLTTGTASIRDPAQPESGSDSLSGSCLGSATAPVSCPKSFWDGFQTCVWISCRIIPNGCHGCDVHETCRRPWNPFNLLAFTFCCQATPQANKMHGHVIL